MASSSSHFTVSHGPFSPAIAYDVVNAPWVKWPSFFVMAESDMPAIVRNSRFLRWEARVLYLSSYLGPIVLFGGFNGLGPYRNAIVEVLLIILRFLAIIFFVRLCIAERQSPGNLPNA
jgi:hypothetical protein